MRNAKCEISYLASWLFPVARRPHISPMSSPTPAERALHKALKERAFAPVYLLHGDEEFLKEDAVRRILEAAVDPATRDFNLEIRRAGDLDGETFGSLLGTPPMMADRRVVV